MRVLLAAMFGLCAATIVHAQQQPPTAPPISASEPMPAKVALFVCRVKLGAPDQNTAFTHHLQAEWDYTGGVLQCRRMEVELYDPAVDMGGKPRPFTQWACNQAGAMLGAQFDVDRWDKPWRYWKHACPTPTVDTATGRILAWELPPCPPAQHGTIQCEGDTTI